MPTLLIIGIGAGAGFVAAALFASATTATALAGILFYLAPLPLCLAGLGWGTAAVVLAAFIGTVIVSALFGPGTGAAFALSIGVPIALLCHLTLLSRPLVTPQGGVTGVEWYPPGRIVGWAAIIAGTLAGVMILLLGYDVDTYRDAIRQLLANGALKEIDQNGTLLNEETISRLSSLLARALPALIASVWLNVALFNLWMGGLIVDASGRALRPWPRLDALELPNFCFIAFTVALIAAFLPGVVGLLATAFAGALFFAYVLQGLAVLHAYSRGLPFRSLMLATVYLAILLLGWIAIAIAILGLAEPIFHLRERASARNAPPGAD